MSKLTKKQELFCREYLKDFNATQAAIRAGFSQKTAYSAGSRLLKNVEIQKIINELNRNLYSMLGITKKRILSEISLIAFKSELDEKVRLKALATLLYDIPDETYSDDRRAINAEKVLAALRRFQK